MNILIEPIYPTELMRHHWLRSFCGAVLVMLSACDSPEKSQFVSSCVGAGDSLQRCSCTFETLERDVGDVDQEFVSFAADFAKWDVDPGESGLDRTQMMQKYELNDEEYRALAGEVGVAMLNALASCE